MIPTAELQALADRMRESERVTVLTGAGVSAASGIPTFRDPGGLWEDFKPEELATPHAFARDPKKVWEWYAWRRGKIAQCLPNRAHEVLAAWSGRYGDFTLVTQNVDGLHERAGTKGVLRFHGSIWEVQCWEGCPESPPRWWDDTHPYPVLPPPCPHCGGFLRPGVVWFGEMIDPQVMAGSARACDCEVFLAIGTSATVHPAAGLLHKARLRGAFTVEINPEATPASSAVDLALAGRAEEVLDQLAEVLGRA